MLNEEKIDSLMAVDRCVAYVINARYYSRRISPNVREYISGVESLKSLVARKYYKSGVGEGMASKLYNEYTGEYSYPAGYSFLNHKSSLNPEISELVKKLQDERESINSDLEWLNYYLLEMAEDIKSKKEILAKRMAISKSEEKQADEIYGLCKRLEEIKSNEEWLYTAKGKKYHEKRFWARNDDEKDNESYYYWKIEPLFHEFTKKYIKAFYDLQKSKGFLREFYIAFNRTVDKYFVVDASKMKRYYDMFELPEPSKVEF